MERNYVRELIDARNRWAHQEPFSSDDAYRALDSAERLLQAISALSRRPRSGGSSTSSSGGATPRRRGA